MPTYVMFSQDDLAFHEFSAKGAKGTKGGCPSRLAAYIFSVVLALTAKFNIVTDKTIGMHKGRISDGRSLSWPEGVKGECSYALEEVLETLW